jgi:hypothetical protein
MSKNAASVEEVNMQLPENLNFPAVFPYLLKSNKEEMRNRPPTCNLEILLFCK